MKQARGRPDTPAPRVRLLPALLLAGLLAATPGAGSPPPQAAEAQPGEVGLNVETLVLARKEIRPGAEQLVQVTLRNAAEDPATAGLRLEVQDERERRVGRAHERRVRLHAFDEQRFYFRVDAPRQRGRYTVRLEVLNEAMEANLLPGAPVFYAGFAVGDGAAMARAEAPQEEGAADGGRAGAEAAVSAPTFQPPGGLDFAPPDLVWENLNIAPASVLVGEPLNLRVDLRNVGGDIARSFTVRVQASHTRATQRTVLISESDVLALAPGEKLEMEFDTVFETDALLGAYNLVLQADVGNRVTEADEENNVLRSEPVRLTEIRHVFPEAGFVFEEAGLFLFRWDSRRFDEFKVQVGTNRSFENPENFFDIPQGDKWTQETEVLPLAGELPGMARGLMEQAGTDTLYWRVVGRSRESGDLGYSQPTSFEVRLQPGENGGSGGGGASGGGAGGGSTPRSGQSGAPAGNATGEQA